MGERRNTSSTAPFDHAELTRLQEKTSDPKHLPSANVAPRRVVAKPSPPKTESPRSRNETLADPRMTTLLAEVERAAADENEIEITVEPTQATPHPHVKRR